MRSFRWLPLIVLLLVAGCDPPDDGMNHDSLGASAGSVEERSSTVAPGDTLNYSLNLTSFGSRATGAEFTVSASGSGWQRPIKQRTTTLATDFRLINTTAWLTSTFKLYAWGVAGVAVSRDSTLIATWTVNRSIGPPPGGSIDSSGVITLRQQLNPENLASLFPVTVIAMTTDSSVRCSGEWVGAQNRSLRILPTFNTDASCLPVLRSMPLNVEALIGDSAAAALPDTSIYKAPPVPWIGTALLPVVDAVPVVLRINVIPATLTLAIGETRQLCAAEVYGDGTEWNSCSKQRTRAT